MFDMSFSEIAVIGAVALVVLGPERLPKVARTAGHLFGRLQRYVNTVKADISREMETSELSKLKQDVQDAARSFEQTVQQHANSVETEAKAIQVNAEKSLAETASTSATGASAAANSATDVAPALPVSSAFAPEQHMTSPPSSPSSTLPPVSVSAAAPAAAPIEQGMFDFGVEPVRGRVSAKPEAQ